MSYAPLYSFLARAFHSPPDDDFLKLAADLPELKKYLKLDLKDQFTWVFEFNVYPYASVFIDPSGMLNSDWAGFVSGVYKALGLEVNVDAGLAADDHLSAQLEAMAALCEREDNSSEVLAKERARHGQKTLLIEQLLPWLLSFVHGVNRIDSGFYSAVASMTLELALEHANDLLIGEEARAFVFPNSEEELQAVQPIDVKKKAGEARSKLQTLITAARSGLFLSRDDITRLGRSLDLPVRFAERPFMLENLVTSASDAGDLSKLFETWRILAKKEKEAIQAMQVKHKNLAPIWNEWLTKLEETQSYLQDLSKA